MNETDSILESRLRSLEPASLDEALLDRLQSCTDDSLLEPRPEDAELVAALAALRPTGLPDSLRTPLLAELEKLPFPADEKVLLFPKAGPVPRTHPSRPASQRSDTWFRAAAVALLGAAAALWLTPSSQTRRGLAGAPPSQESSPATAPATPATSRPASPNSLVPTSYDRSLREARNEGIVWQDDRQPHHLIRVVYRDHITLRDANGQTIQVEKPRVEYILVPGKID